MYTHMRNTGLYKCIQIWLRHWGQYKQTEQEWPKFQGVKYLYQIHRAQVLSTSSTKITLN